MPIYEYECDACRRTFERRQKFSDEPVRECPECQGPVNRLIHPAPIIFKGSGFYVTDSRGAPAASNEAAPDTTSAAESPGSGDKSSSAAGASAGSEKASGDAREASV